MLDYLLDKEPSTGMYKWFDTNYQKVKNEYYLKVAFLIYSADNAFFSYKLPLIFKRVLENLKVDPTKINSKNTDDLYFLELNMLILRMT